jgi:hypothetical protein
VPGKGRIAVTSEHHTGPVETGAPMDYREHEKTYGLFLAAAKYGTMAIAALMIAMAAGFFGGAGLFGGFVAFIVLLVLGYVLVG